MHGRCGALAYLLLAICHVYRVLCLEDNLCIVSYIMVFNNENYPPGQLLGGCHPSLWAQHEVSAMEGIACMSVLSRLGGSVSTPITIPQNSSKKLCLESLPR